jgi:alginate O-acetyltransferase complex protein AlgJ
MRRWLNISYLPVTIGAVLLIIPWFYLSWNTTLGELIPAMRFRTKNTIAGVVSDASDTFSLHSVLNGHYQQSISRAVGVLSPLFKPAIHWKNQIYYTLLGTAGSDRVVVGKHRQLLEMTYLDEYCARDAATFQTKAEDWAARIRTLQDEVQALGKPFVYVITPSKVAQYPQFIPDGYKCPAGYADKGSKLAVWDAALTSHGVRFVDGASPLPAAREKYGIDMFPRGGIHWNKLAAALATQDVIAAVNAQHASPPLMPFTFTWTISYKPDATDRDLLDIMNLPHPDRHFPVPELSYQSAEPPGGCKPLKITEVGGSFLMGINNTLEALACPPEITYWFYWDHNRFRYADRQMRELTMDADVRRKSLLDADVVFFEENEAALPDSRHGQALMDELKAIRAGS